MKYLIVVLLSALFCLLTAPKAPALTNRSVHNVDAVQSGAKKPAPAKTVQLQPEQKAVAIPQPPVIATDTHEQLMAAAGINPADYGAADYIISHESSWNSNATEPTTGAHGLPQALPYSKTGCGWTDSICQLHWANSYAIARYGSWAAAQVYWENHRNW